MRDPRVTWQTGSSRSFPQMLMSVSVRLTFTARARDTSPSVPMLLLLTDRLTEEGGNEWHNWKARPVSVSRWHSRSQTTAWRRQCLAHVHGSLILDPIERQINDVQGGVRLQHVGQAESTIAAQAVTAESQSDTVHKSSQISCTYCV